MNCNCYYSIDPPLSTSGKLPTPSKEEIETVQQKSLSPHDKQMACIQVTETLKKHEILNQVRNYCYYHDFDIVQELSSKLKGTEKAKKTLSIELQKLREVN